jgi:hypothetical protein
MVNCAVHLSQAHTSSFDVVVITRTRSVWQSGQVILAVIGLSDIPRG